MCLFFVCGLVFFFFQIKLQQCFSNEWLLLELCPSGVFDQQCKEFLPSFPSCATGHWAMQGLWPWLNHFGLGLFWLKADILHSSSSTFLASLLSRGRMCMGNWLLYAQLLTAAQRSGGPAGGALGRAGSHKERKCGEKERTVHSPVAGIKMA